MSQKDNILQELKELNASLPHQPGNIYQVPAGYFDGLADQVIARIKAMEVADSNEELELLSPFLNNISRKMPYQIPQGYFENINTVVGRENKKPAKLVVLNPRRTWLRYAAAAIVTGLIVVLTGYYFRGHKDEGMRVMAKLTRDVKKMNETQKENLLNFIDAGTSGNEVAQVAPDNKTTIKILIQGVSEEELKDFQEQTEDVEDVLMTN